MTLILRGTDNSASAPSVQGGTGGTTTGVYYPATNQVALATNGTQAVLVDASQNISIGGAVAVQKFNVKGITAFEAISGSTNNWQAYTYTDNTYRWNYNGSGADELVLNSNGVLALKNASTTADGIGITFPATQSASSDVNTLDDYEEGTWTPTDGSGAGLTFTAASGIYVKIGKLVIAQGSWSYPITGNTSGARMNGLPFACATNGGGFSMYASVAYGAAIRNQASSTNTFLVRIESQVNALTNNMLSGGDIQVTFIYQST
jgi:hypothetical protein